MLKIDAILRVFLFLPFLLLALSPYLQLVNGHLANYALSYVLMCVRGGCMYTSQRIRVQAYQQAHNF